MLPDTVQSFNKPTWELFSDNSHRYHTRDMIHAEQASTIRGNVQTSNDILDNHLAILLPTMHLNLLVYAELTSHLTELNISSTRASPAMLHETCIAKKESKIFCCWNVMQWEREKKNTGTDYMMQNLQAINRAMSLTAKPWWISEKLGVLYMLEGRFSPLADWADRVVSPPVELSREHDLW